MAVIEFESSTYISLLRVRVQIRFHFHADGRLGWNLHDREKYTALVLCNQRYTTRVRRFTFRRIVQSRVFFSFFPLQEWCSTLHLCTYTQTCAGSTQCNRIWGENVFFSTAKSEKVDLTTCCVAICSYYGYILVHVRVIMFEAFFWARTPYSTTHIFRLEKKRSPFIIG